MKRICARLKVVELTPSPPPETVGPMEPDAKDDAAALMVLVGFAVVVLLVLAGIGAGVAYFMRSGGGF
jgi:hypothetical protein